jgi:hypothetical protein
MTTRERNFYQQGMNMYVPGMAAASNIQIGRASQFSLGTPAAVSATLIASATAANSVAGTKVTYTTVTMDSPYGRTLRLTPSADPGNSAAIDIFGEDYLGQPMVERFTGASGSTAILYGAKAFYRVLYSKVVTAATNAVTWGIGTGFRLGLPYKGDVVWSKENGVYVPMYNRDTWLFADQDAAEAIAGGTKYFRSPFPGFVKTLKGLSSGAGSTNDAVVTVTLATVAIVGLTVTIDSNVAGNETTDTPTTLGYNANNRLIAGSLIAVVTAAAAGAGPQRVGLELTPTQFTPAVTTDPQTTTTADPRGTYESLFVYDGATNITIGLLGDPSVNAAGNGGLHGIRHVIA